MKVHMKRLRTAANRMLAKVSRPVSFAMLPLSLVPLMIAVPMVVTAHRNYVRYYKSPPFAAPKGVLTPSETAAFHQLPAFTGQVPVLVYYGINNRHNSFSVTQRTFAAQMGMLRMAGFRTISITQYNAFQHGNLKGLPARPILITFDGGRLDSYRGADQVLAREGFSATMFVITGAIARKNPTYLSWTELHRMEKSGRWDIQPETYRGHTKVATDARGDQAPFYAARRYLRSTGEETFSDYQRRVAGDLFTLASQFKAQGLPTDAIAMPFGDYGQQSANDPRIVPFTLGLLKAQFGTVFVQAPNNDPSYTTPTDGGPQQRWQASRSTTPWDLYVWLRGHDPASTSAASATPGAATGPATTTQAAATPTAPAPAAPAAPATSHHSAVTKRTARIAHHHRQR